MLVSVILPSFNHEKYVIEAVRSVLDQTYRRLELIVIDDGSSDRSVELLRDIVDPRLRLVVQENAGAHAAINRGFAMAEGDYLAIINSDDRYAPERLERCLATLDANDADLVSTWLRVIDADGEQIGLKQGWRNMRPQWASSAVSSGYWDRDDYVLNLISSNFVSTTSNILLRRRVYENIGGMRPLRFSHDWDFLLRAAASFKCVEAPEPLADYRIHGKNTISSNREWMLFEVAWTLAANLHRFAGPQFLGSAGKDTERAGRIAEFAASVNLKGCDRLFWILSAYLRFLSETDASNPAEELLENEMLRQVFIDLVDPPQ